MLAKVQASNHCIKPYSNFIIGGVLATGVITAVVLGTLFIIGQVKASRAGPGPSPELLPTPNDTFKPKELLGLSRQQCLDKVAEAEEAVKVYQQGLLDIDKEFAAGHMTQEQYEYWKAVFTQEKNNAMVWQEWFLERADQLLDRKALFWQNMANRTKWPAVVVGATFGLGTGSFIGFRIYRYFRPAKTEEEAD
ncbi:MAG TPA: hypothetical protein VEK06_05185 [Myxococcota bacterium]|nr:hypothetical protein [Myxococcota bacterium]